MNIDALLWFVVKVLLGLFGVGLLGIIIWKIRIWRLYKYKAEVYERDNLGQLTPFMDKFTIMVNGKTNKEMGRLLKTKDWIGLEEFNFQTVRKGRKSFKLVRLLKTGEGSYIYLKPHIEQTNGELELKVTREDTDWAINMFWSCTQTYGFRDRLKEMMPMLIMFAAIIGVVIVSYFLIKQFPTAADALTATGESIRAAAADVLKAAQINGNVIS